MSKKSCEFQLIGGLGNQLFILMAATQHLKQGFPTTINTSNLEHYGTNHGNTVEDIYFPFHTPEFKSSKTKLSSKEFRLVSHIIRKLGIRQFGNWRVENENGYVDLSHLSNKRGIKHLGYFQSSRIFEQGFGDSIYGMEPKKPSKKFEVLLKEAESTKPVFLHIRRGDYLLQKDQLGVLNFEYYENAFTRLKGEGIPFSEVWIVSTDEQLGTELGEKLGINYRVISSESGLSDIETLILMKYGTAHIIANSTYSWWGAYIAKNTNCVIAPKPWFRNHVIPQDHIPASWIEVESLWV